MITLVINKLLDSLEDINNMQVSSLLKMMGTKVIDKRLQNEDLKEVFDEYGDLFTKYTPVKNKAIKDLPVNSQVELLIAYLTILYFDFINRELLTKHKIYAYLYHGVKIDNNDIKQLKVFCSILNIIEGK